MMADVDEALPLLPAETTIFGPYPAMEPEDTVAQPATPMLSAPMPAAATSVPPAAPQVELPPGAVRASTVAMAPPPPPTAPPGARVGAGIGLLAAAGGTLAGWVVLGGIRGAAAGLLLTGAARNGLRAWRHWGATEAGRRAEARTSATMGLLGGAVGGYLAYAACQKDGDDRGAD